MSFGMSISGAYGRVEIVEQKLPLTITRGARYKRCVSIGHFDVHLVQTRKFGIELKWPSRLRRN